MRKKIIAGNWKMNINPSQTKELAKIISEGANGEADVVLCVPFTNLSVALEAVKGTDASIGAQNIHQEKKGAYTGEISADMLADMGVKYVIVGHSERRQYFGETDELVNKKAHAALAAGLIPIICVGEVLVEREANKTLEVIERQTKAALVGIEESQAKTLIIAYEPVWAIGTGKTATSDQAEEVCKAIRELLAEIYNKEISDIIRIQYGGSVNGANAKELFSMPNIDGGLVGGASITPEFLKVVNY